MDEKSRSRTAIWRNTWPCVPSYEGTHDFAWGSMDEHLVSRTAPWGSPGLVCCYKEKHLTSRTALCENIWSRVTLSKWTSSLVYSSIEKLLVLSTVLWKKNLPRLQFSWKNSWPRINFYGGLSCLAYSSTKEHLASRTVLWWDTWPDVQIYGGTRVHFSNELLGLAYSSNIEYSSIEGHLVSCIFLWWDIWFYMTIYMYEEHGASHTLLWWNI